MSNGYFNEDQQAHMKSLGAQMEGWAESHQTQGHMVRESLSSELYMGLLCSCGTGWNYWEGCEVPPPTAALQIGDGPA